MTGWIGKRRLRVEDPPLLTGQGKFVADLAGSAAHLRFVRSPVPHGRIVGVEAPDDITFFRGEDLVGVKPLVPMLHHPKYVPVAQPILAQGKTRFVGEAVAIVVGKTPEEAEDAAERVYVDIEPLDHVTDVGQAIRPESPRVHDQAPGNQLIEGQWDTGGVDQAWARAGQVVEFELRSGRQSAMPLEARGCVADYDQRSGRITLHTSTQSPHLVRTAIADLVGMPEADLRVITPDVGGAFGQKFCLAVEDVAAVWVARRLRRRVAWIEDRRENLLSSFHSRDHRYRVRGAFATDGRLIALDADLLCNVGAYSCYPVTCGVEPLMAFAELPGPYDFQEYRVRSRGITTNTCPMAPYRGVSRPVLTFAMERLMDLAARALKLDPVEIRRINLVKEFPYRSATGLEYDEGSYVQALEKAVDAVGLSEFRARQETAWAHGKYLGVGFSVFSERTGYGTPAFAARGMEITIGYETVDMVMDPSGNVEVRIGASPHGQGLETSLAQLVADAIGMDADQVRVVHGDTDRTPYGWGTFASRSMVLAGGAAKMAAGQLQDKLIRIAARAMEAAPEDIQIRQGRAEVKGSGSGMELSELARMAYHASHRLEKGEPPGLAFTSTYDPAGTFSNACHVAMVEVDPETGRVQIERFVVVEDAGVLINPMIVDGQLHGGITQGIAAALYEEVLYDQAGNNLTASLMDFLPPTIEEVPWIEIHHLETVSPATLTGAKGLGEGGTIGAPVAVINAICDALRPLGVEVNEMPATPQRLRQLIRSKEKVSA